MGISSNTINPRLEADAEVLTKLPQKVSVGLAWQATNQLLLTTEFNWIDWSAAFDELPVTLANSSNAAVNNLVGSDTFTDVISLGWQDQKIIRIGAEYDIDNVWTVRVGASYSTAVSPSQTITPLNAALAESVISAGVGYQQPGWHLDFSWQWHLPITEKTSRSDLLSGEYSDSSIELESHWLGLTYGFNF